MPAQFCCAPAAKEADKSRPPQLPAHRCSLRITDGHGQAVLIGVPDGLRAQSGLLALSGERETGRVTGKPASRTSDAWRPWTVWLPCVLAVAWSILLAVADGYAGVLNSWGGNAPHPGWLGAGAAGQGVLAVGTAGVLVAGTTNRRWRRGAVITAWTVIPVAFAWFVLTGRLSSRS